MPEKHFILCGGISDQSYKSQGKTYALKLGKEEGNIHLNTEKIVQKMVRHIDPVMHDFLEIAAYVYVGDQIVFRGDPNSFDYAKKWHRELYYTIPVCDYETWNHPDIKSLLEESLSFAAGETYHFEFVKHSERDRPDFLIGDGRETDNPDFKKVVMFSGGIDSFAGALEEITSNPKKVCLVGHYSNNKVLGLQRKLHEYLVALQLTRKASKPLYIPVEVNKPSGMTREKSQRSRSFLFAVLGAVIANYEKLSEVTFFENGVVSCNLPWDGQTLQAKATRTTHPKFINLLSKLVSAILQKDFVFVNPYFELTKKEVIDRLVKYQQEAKIRDTRSCAGAFYTNPETHCGVCSQCIDRRFATLAAQCLEHDPLEIYETNILTGAIEKKIDQTMATGFAGFSVQTAAATQDGFFRKYPSEISDIIRYFPDNKSALDTVFLLHQRFAQQVNKVLGNKIAEYNHHLVNGLLPDTCLLQMVAMQKHLKMSLDKYQEKEHPTTEEDVPITVKNAMAILAVSEGHISRLKKQGKLKEFGGKISRNSVLVYKQKREEKQLESDLLDIKRDAAKLKRRH